MPRWGQDSAPLPVMGPYGVPIYQPATGHMEFRTEQYMEMVDHPYACTQFVRWVEGFVCVEVRIVARTACRRWRGSGPSTCPIATSRPACRVRLGRPRPGPVSGPAVLDRLHGQVVAPVTSAMVPRRDTSWRQLFDRGALRGFAGRFYDSMADLARALELRPEATA